jgi:hypothetical protein
MRVWPLALVCGGGCAQLFGLDVTTSTPDANPDEVSLAVQRVSVGSTVVKAPEDMTGQMATFYADDGTGTPGILVPPNKFTAPITMGTPPVVFSVPGDTILRYFASSRAQTVNHVAFERPGMVQAADTSKITVGITLPSAYVSGEAFNVVAIGPWTQHPLAAAELPLPDMGLAAISTPAIDYVTGFGSLVSSMTRAKITSADYVVVLRTVGSRLTGYLETQFDQTDGTDTISGTMIAITANRTLNATIDPAAFTARFMAAKPAVAGLSLNYSIAAAPGADVGQTRGIQLVAGGSNPMTDTAVTVSYGNPFDGHGWKSLVTYSATSQRMTTFMTAPVTLGATMQTVSDPEQTMAITLPAGLPTTIKANNTELVTDGMDVALDLTKPVTITATIDKPSATYYSVAVSEITVTGMTAERTLVISAASTTPTFTLPQMYFQLGHTYVVQFRAHEGGYLNAAGGDFANFTLPHSTSTLDSALFTVVAP